MTSRVHLPRPDEGQVFVDDSSFTLPSRNGFPLDGKVRSETIDPGTQILRLDLSFADPSRTRHRLLELLSDEAMGEEGALYTLSILESIPIAELLSKDAGYRFAVDCALTFGVFVAPLHVDPNLADQPNTPSGEPSNALRFILTCIDNRSTTYLAEGATPLTLLEKILLNADRGFASALTHLDEQLTHFGYPRDWTSIPSIRRAVDAACSCLGVTASQRYKYLLEKR